MHQDVVHSLPPGVELLGSSPRCDIQGMYKPGRFITFQGHPEFNEDIVRDIMEVKRTLVKAFTDEFVAESLGRVHLDHDGKAIGAVVLKFLLGDHDDDIKRP